MRIIGGQYRRRRFDVPKNFNARPTTDFAKENLFNILEHRYELEGARILDLFAGTGGISLEFLSRGAQQVCAVEKRPQHAQFITKVRDLLGEEDRLNVMVADAFRWIEQPREASFDIIFADPPYDHKALAELPEKIFGSNLLDPKAGVFILEHPGQYDFSSFPHFLEHRVYGSVNFSIFSFIKE